MHVYVYHYIFYTGCWDNVLLERSRPSTNSGVSPDVWCVVVASPDVTRDSCHTRGCATQPVTYNNSRYVHKLFFKVYDETRERLTE